MSPHRSLLGLLTICSVCYSLIGDVVPGTNSSLGSEEREEIKIQMSVMIRNKPRILPQFLDLVDNLRFPKKKISLWMRCDEVERDPSCNILDTWLAHHGPEYLSIDVDTTLDNPDKVSDGRRELWPEERMKRIIEFRMDALSDARKRGFSHIFFIDADVLLTNADVLQELLDAKKTIVAPFIRGEMLEANFGTAQPDNVQEQDIQAFLNIYNGRWTGTFKVKYVHTCFLIDLRNPKTSQISFVSKEKSKRKMSQWTDVRAFMKSSDAAGIEMFLLRNQRVHGAMPIIRRDTYVPPKFDLEDQISPKIWATRYGPHIFNLSLFHDDLVFRDPEPLHNVRKVYVINLEKRRERRIRMEYCLQELGIEYQLVKAVEGTSLTRKDFQNLKIGFPPSGYGLASQLGKHRMEISRGNIGLMLTSLKIWKQMVQNNTELALILEDDAHFIASFREHLKLLIEEADKLVPQWDLIYLFQWTYKSISPEEHPVEDSEYLYKAPYSHGSTGYLLKRSGARKLLAGNPLKFVLPVDEYLALMSGTHFDKKLGKLRPMDVSEQLNAFATLADFIEPTTYDGDPFHHSDTSCSSCEPVPDDWFVNGKVIAQNKISTISKLTCNGDSCFSPLKEFAKPVQDSELEKDENGNTGRQSLLGKRKRSQYLSTDKANAIHLNYISENDSVCAQEINDLKGIEQCYILMQIPVSL